jgi:hypothetical protein
MSNRIFSINGWPAGFLVVLAVVLAIAGCGDTGKSSNESASGSAASATPRNETPDGKDVLRIREDVVRNRLWVLTLNEVRIYSTAATGKRLIRTVTLPAWSVIGFRNVCMPDLVLDRSGAAFISSNGEARLVRIDADRIAIEDYAIAFNGREGVDIGFGALAFAADGTLFGRTTPDGMLWKIDVAKASATPASIKIKLPADPCATTTPLVIDFERI